MKSHKHLCEHCSRMKLMLLVAIAALVGLAALYLGGYRVSEDDQGRIRIRQVQVVEQGSLEVIEEGSLEVK